MKFIRTVYILLALAVFTQQASSNFKGCVQVVEGVCLECYKRKALPNGAGCGPLQPDSDNCLLYTWTKGRGLRCLACKKGFSGNLVQTKTGSILECQKGTIQHCIFEYGFSDGTHACGLCDEGRYSVSVSNGSSDICSKVKNPALNCEDGASAAISPPLCGVCQQGYSVEGNGRKCAKSPQPGCWIASAGKCSACNPFAGYSMGPDGKCF